MDINTHMCVYIYMYISTFGISHQIPLNPKIFTYGIGISSSHSDKKRKSDLCRSTAEQPLARDPDPLQGGGHEVPGFTRLHLGDESWISCPDAPCSWYIYLQNWASFRVNGGKYCMHEAYGIWTYLWINGFNMDNG